MRNRCSSALLLAAVLVTSAALVAQVPGDIPPRPQTSAGGLADLKVAFAGLDDQGLALYLIQARLQPANRADGCSKSYLVVLRDANSGVIDSTDERYQAVIDADPEEPSEHTLMLCQAWFQVGPLYLEVTDGENGDVLRSVGPLQVPEVNSGLTPYGAVGSGNDQLHLHAEGHATPGSHIRFTVFGMEPGSWGVLGFSPTRTEIPVLGGTLRVGPEAIFPIYFQARDDGVAEVEITTDPALMGVKFYAQAVALDVEPTGEDRILFSNGIEIAMEPRL